MWPFKKDLITPTIKKRLDSWKRSRDRTGNCRSKRKKTQKKWLSISNFNK